MPPSPENCTDHHEMMKQVTESVTLLGTVVNQAKDLYKKHDALKDMLHEKSEAIMAAISDLKISLADDKTARAEKATDRARRTNDRIMGFAGKLLKTLIYTIGVTTTGTFTYKGIEAFILKLF